MFVTYANLLCIPLAAKYLIPKMKSGIAPTAVEAHQGAEGLLTLPRFPPPEDPPIETDEPPTEIDELITEPPEETDLCL